MFLVLNLAPEKRKGFRVIKGLFNILTGTLKPWKIPQLFLKGNRYT